MCACTRPICPRYGEDDEGNDHYDERGRGISGSATRTSGGEAATADYDGSPDRPGQRYHNPTVFKPPPTWSDYVHMAKIRVIRSINDAYAFYKWLRNDRFRWELFKSVLWFTMGMKLFNDITRHYKCGGFFGSEGAKGSKGSKDCTSSPVYKSSKPIRGTFRLCPHKYTANE